ncbi:MAG: hypothetical protein WBN65_06785 [Gammaproteobacteria bacterium]
MHEARHQNDEDRLRGLFARNLDAPPDDGFTEAVMRRIQRRLRTRKTVLTIATVGGGLLALGPAYDLSLAFSNAITQATAGWSGTDWLPQYRILAMAALTAILAPVVTAIVDD